MRKQYQKIKEHILNGKIDDALQELNNFTTSTEYENQAILLQSRYNKIQRDRLLDIGEEITLQKERNKINLGILEIIDKVIEDFIFEVIKFNEIFFFESEYDVPEIQNRKHSNIFDCENARYIYWQLEIVYPRINFELPFKLNWRYLDLTRGIQMNNSSTELGVTPKVQGLSHHHGWGYNEKGNWREGRYKLEIRYKKRILIENEFEIK